MAITWVVTADSAQAEFFEVDRIGGEFRTIQELTHAEALKKGRELTTDRPGRAFDSAGTGRHAMSTQVDPKEHEADVFAREICHYIEGARSKHRFERLIVIAPPDFLGRIRQQITPAANRMVVESIAKNLTGCNGTEIRARLKTLI
jgi:protein required for attachment to host cells